jgi:hypothetical protein
MTLLMALASCGPGPGTGNRPSPPSPPTPPTPPNPAAQDSVTFNAMTFNAMTFNALMLHPNEKLKDYSLQQVVAPGSPFEPDLANDPYSREFLEYLVSCALPQGDAITWQSQTWPGELGLCPAWKDSAPDLACQELVSSCLLARINAYGETVQISLRGLYTNDAPLPLASTEVDQFGWPEGGFFGNIFCPDCVDVRMSMKVEDGELVYRLVKQGVAPVEVRCETGPQGLATGPQGLAARTASAAAARRVRDACHRRFIAASQWQGVMYKSMFACWSPVWADGEAYTRRRICAGVASTGGVVDDQKQCAAWPVGACGDNSPVVTCQTSNVCAVMDTMPRPKDGDVDDCAGQPQDVSSLPDPGTCPPAPTQTTPVWRRPLTVFLAQPYAVVPGNDAGRLNPRFLDPASGRPMLPREAGQTTASRP